jgi:hypothetical protein
MATTTTTAPANLRETKREMAAAKRAAKAPAKKAPAKATKAQTIGRAMAAKAAAKAPARKAPASTSTKLRWQVEGEPGTATPATATRGDRKYAIGRDGDAWKATVKVGTKTTVLVAGGTFARCYAACTAHNKAAA